MAATVHLLLHSPPSSTLSSHNATLLLPQTTHRLPSSSHHHFHKHLTRKSSLIPFAVTGDSPKSIDSPDPDPQFLLQQLADSFVLPADYFSQLPGDLRLDLNDAAFDLSNGPVTDECGKELGETLLNISRAWEAADTLTSITLVSKLPSLVVDVTDNSKSGKIYLSRFGQKHPFLNWRAHSHVAFHMGQSAFGKRLLSSGRRFQSMGQYGQGELQQIAKTMIMTGKLLAATKESAVASEDPNQGTRMFKFGELQVALTPQKAYIGAAIGFFFGIISWELSQGVQNIPESSLQYANENALLLAKSLRGTILAIFYSSTVLSAFSTVGLVLLGRQLQSEKK